jgi:hypothetical protein
MPFRAPTILRHFAGAEHDVDLGDLRLELIPIALAQTAGDDQPLTRAPALQLGHFEDRVDRLLLGRVDERARVDHDHFGLARVCGHFMTGVACQSQHDLAIDKVLGAAEGEET